MSGGVKAQQWGDLREGGERVKGKRVEIVNISLSLHSAGPGFCETLHPQALVAKTMNTKRSSGVT